MPHYLDSLIQKDIDSILKQGFTIEISLSYNVYLLTVKFNDENILDYSGRDLLELLLSAKRDIAKE